MILSKYLSIGKRKIGQGYPTFIVAEMSGNHNHSFKKALKIVDAAANAGVDAIKLQTYTPDSLTIDCDNQYFQVKGNKLWKGQTLYNLYKKAYTPWEWQKDIFKYANSKKLIAFSTPFDESAVNFLEKLNAPIYKVASFEITDLELLKSIGKTKKPVIVSRGLASIKDISLAIKTLKNAGTKEIAILHCVSSYPSTIDQMNVSTIADISKRFGVVSGLSDHSLDPIPSLTSISFGAKIIEKHLTIKRSEGGPDAKFSLEPEELKYLVGLIRKTELAIGKPTYDIGIKEKENLLFRRSLFVVKNIHKDENFSNENIRSIRPGYGLPPKYLRQVLGKKAKSNIKRGTPLNWNKIA